MSKYYKPVLNYKLSFDYTKGEKNRMEIHYQVQVGGAGRGQAQGVAQIRMMTRTAEVRICETTAVDENLWTISKFKRERIISQMSWEEARFNFTKCLGEVPQL